MSSVVAMIATELTLPVMSPFRLDLTVWALRRRQKNIIDRWDGRQYTRVVVLEGKLVKITVTQQGTVNHPQLRVVLQSVNPLTLQTRKAAKQLVRKMFGLDIDLQSFYALAKNNVALKPLATQFKGVRPPRFPSVFEALINSIACQQVSLDVGIMILNRLTEKFGLEIADNTSVLHAFPRPEDLLDISEESIKKLGFSYQKARAIKGLAYDVASGSIDLSRLETASNEEVASYLSSIHGIGRWSSEYVLLRGLGRLDVLPGDDVGAQKNLQQLLSLGERPDYARIKQLTKKWHPYEGLVYFHLLLQKLAAKEIL